MKIWLISGSVKNSISTKFEQAHFDLAVHHFTISDLIKFHRLRWYQMASRILFYSELLRKAQNLYVKA